MADNDPSPQDEYHPTLTSPEGILMIFFAALIYIVGIVCLALDVFFGIGEIPRLIVDVISTIVLGGWMMVRGGTPRVGSKFKQFVKKRLGWMVAEDIPFLGDLFPGDIIATLGFLSQQNQPAYTKAISNTAKISRAVALLFLLLPPLKSLAAEISYPPFFRIDQATSIPDLLKIFYSAALGIGAILAACYLVFLGFKILTSRGRPQHILEVRKRIGQVLIGLALLAGSVLILRTINPELPILQLGPMSFGTIPSTLSGPTIPPNTGQGQEFDSFNLGRTLNETDIFLNKIDTDPVLAETKDTLATLRERTTATQSALSQCSPNLCMAGGSIGYNAQVPPYGYCGAPSTCNPSSCNGPSPGVAGEPCPQRNDANAKLSQTVALFIDVQNFYNNIVVPERSALENCEVASRGTTSLFDFLTAQQLATQQGQNLNNLCSDNPEHACHESEDYFCATGEGENIHFSRVHLSLDKNIGADGTLQDGLLQKEQEFIDNVDTIVGDISSCSCSNAQDHCPDGPCYGTGTCAENPDPTIGVQGCTPDMWQKVLPDLLHVADRMRALHDHLYYLPPVTQIGGTPEGVMNRIDGLQALSTLYSENGENPDKYFYVETCLSTQGLTQEFPACPNDSAVCCPNKDSRADIKNCVLEDFYAMEDCTQSTSTSP